MQNDNKKNRDRAGLPTVTAGEITYAIEYLTTALRALVDGHAPDSQMVEQPLLWGYSKIAEMSAPALQRGRKRAA